MEEIDKDAIIAEEKCGCIIRCDIHNAGLELLNLCKLALESCEDCLDDQDGESCRHSFTVEKLRAVIRKFE